MSKRLSIYRDENPIYDIIIERNWDLLGSEIAKIGLSGRKYCIVSDTNVAPYHLQSVKDSILANCNPIEVVDFVFPAGEEYKTLYTVKDLYEKLILSHFERKDILIALGGGVVGDLTGYAAATYLRGIDFIQVPTTLLSQVDSSIGGKTGVDFDSYKNMVGAFHMPKMVYMNMSTLQTLEKRVYLSGYGEIIKHAYIKDVAYLDTICSHLPEILARDLSVLEDIIYRSCCIKGDVVRKDPTEKGERMLLNFGHTLGHAIEKLCGFSMFHGECVGLGMLAALQLSVNRGSIGQKVLDHAVVLLKELGFPTTVHGMTAEDIIATSKSDKKMQNGKIRFILLNQVGEGVIDYEVTEEEMKEALTIVL